jgi:hypothetical protein
MKLGRFAMLLAAAWLPGAIGAHYRRATPFKMVPPPKPPQPKYDSMAANLQRAAAQSFLRHRVSVEDKELKIEKEQMSAASQEIDEMASRLDLEERRSASLAARVNILEQNQTKLKYSAMTMTLPMIANDTAMIARLQDQQQAAMAKLEAQEQGAMAKLQAQEQAAVAKLQAQDQATIDKLQAQVKELEHNATEQAKKIHTQARIPTVMHVKVPGKGTSNAKTRTLETQTVPSNEPSSASKDVILKKNLMDAIKVAVASMPAPAKPQVDASTSTGNNSVPSTWCPPPCDEHNTSAQPEVDAKIDEVHAAMAIVSGTNNSKDLDDRISQAREIIMKSAEDRASKLFDSESAAGTNEISDSTLNAARQADQMLNSAAGLTPHNTTGKTIDDDTQLKEKADAEDSDEGLEAAVSQIVPPEDNGELTKMTAKERVDAADKVVQALDEQDQETPSKSVQADAEEQAAQHLKDEIIVAAKEQGFTPANDSIVVLPTVDLDEPSPQNAELKDEEQLSVIKNANADAANQVNAAEGATEKLDQEVHQTMEELKETHATDKVEIASSQDGSEASKQLVPSEMEQMEALAKAQVRAKPTEEENKMVRDANEYAETEPQRQQKEDASMTKQQLQDAVAYARQQNDKDDQHQIDDIVKQTSEADDVDAGDVEDEQELDKLSKEGLVVDSDSSDQPTVQQVAEVNNMSGNQITAEDQDAPSEGQPAVEDVEHLNPMPQEAAESLKASAKGLVAAVANEDAIAKEAQAAQQEDEQVDKEELDRMSHAGIAAANDLEAELSKIDH